MNDSTRTTAFLRPCTRVYLALLALTMATWLIGRAGLSGLPVALLVLMFAMFKGMLIGDYFMGLRRVQGPWRWAVIAWLLIPGGLISWAFVISS